MTKPTYEELQAELWLLEEVCAFYANDEDRYLKAEGLAEPYGLIPTPVGMKARSARKRFLERESVQPDIEDLS
jgi:hypothetical protein